MKKIIFIILFSFIIFYCGAQGIWVQKSNVFSTHRAGVVGFSIGTKGYLGTGWTWHAPYVYGQDLWEWDRVTDSWTQKANFPGAARGDAVGFSIGNKGYLGTGIDITGNYNNDFWEWDQPTNIWTQKANFPGAARAFAIGFSIGSKGYIGTGNSYLADFWEWDQATNTWTQKANFGGGNRAFAIGFSIGSKGYVGTGEFYSQCFNDFWEYNPTVNTWTQKANVPGNPRERAACFSINKKGYVGTGYDGSNTIYNDFWEWDQTTNTWTLKANYPHLVSDIDHASFSIGCQGYFGCGVNNPADSLYYNDFWEYTPDDLPPIAATISNCTTICIGTSVSLSASGGTNYTWTTGDSTNTIVVSPSSATTYSVIVSDNCSSSETTSTTVSVIDSAKSLFTYSFDACLNKCMSFIDQSVNALSWSWDFGDGNNSTLKKNCHTYNDSSIYNVSLIINQSTNCVDTFSMQVPWVTHDTSAFVYVPNAFSPNNDGSNDVLQFFRQDKYCLKDFELTIYDRWGIKVFETNNINDSWDGTLNGEPLNSSVLVYYCKTTTQSGLQEIKKGNISIVR